MTLLKVQCGVMLLTAGLISSALLMGCESNFDHERFYTPVATRDGAPQVTAQPSRTIAPKLVYSHDPDRDARALRQNGYVLIGTTSFNGAPDLSYDRAVVKQGQKVGAAIVLLKARPYSTMTLCCAPDASLAVSSPGGASYFASYWAKSDAARTSEP